MKKMATLSRINNNPSLYACTTSVPKYVKVPINMEWDVSLNAAIVEGFNTLLSAMGKITQSP